MANVYDALTSRRAYREALTSAAALAIIAADTGLDARCVAALPATLARVRPLTDDRRFDTAPLGRAEPAHSLATDSREPATIPRARTSRKTVM